MTTSPAILEAESLSASYSRAEVLKQCSVRVMPSEAVVVLGPNGAGKSTLMRALMGLIPATTGQINFLGRPIEQWPTRKRACAGMVLVPEGRGILGPLTVIENLQLGAYGRNGTATRSDINASFARVFELFPRLRERRGQKAGSLSGGEQQMLAIARALVADPRLMLLDEPSLGLAPRVTEEIFNALRGLNQQGLSLLIVEQKAPPALQLAERVYVLRTGRIVAEMPARDVDGLESLAHLYLGG
jgi:branched-chain amino acid transport system ATP-binding protein